MSRRDRREPIDMSFDHVKVAEVKPGMTLEADGDFTCLGERARRRVRADANGGLFICCSEGRHMLDGQIRDKADGGYDEPVYIGLRVFGRRAA